MDACLKEELGVGYVPKRLVYMCEQTPFPDSSHSHRSGCQDYYKKLSLFSVNARRSDNSFQYRWFLKNRIHGQNQYTQSRYLRLGNFKYFIVFVKIQGNANMV